MNIKKTFILSLIAFVAVSSIAAIATKPAKAFTTSATQVVQFTIQAAAQLTLTGTDPYNFGNVDPLGSVYTATGAESATVKANTPSWNLYIKGSGPFTSGANTVALSQLGAVGSCVTNCTGATVTAMTTSDQTLATGSAATSGKIVSVDYNLTINWADVVSPTYQATMTYTLIAP